MHKLSFIPVSTQKKLLFCVFALMSIVYARDVMMYPVSDTLLTLICFVPMVVLSYSDLVCFLFFLFPLTCGIPGYIMTLSFVFVLIKGRKLSRKQVLPLAIIVLLELLTEGTLGFEVLTGIVSFLSFIALFFYFLNSYDDLRFDRKQCILWSSVGIAFTFIVIFVNMISQYGFIGILSGSFRSGALGIVDNDLEAMKGHLALNANSIAYYSICALTSLITCIRLYSEKILVSIIILVLLVVGFLSFSRTYILCLALFGVTFFLGTNNHSRKIFLIMTTLLVFIGYFVFNDYVAEIINVMINRSENGNIEEAGGRTSIFSLYNKVWADNPFYLLFGCGVVDYRNTLHMTEAMHSGLQQIWICLGGTGLFLFCQQIFHYLKHYKYYNDFTLCIPFLISLLFDQSIQFLNPYSLIMPIMTPLFVCQLYKKQ